MEHHLLLRSALVTGDWKVSSATLFSSKGARRYAGNYRARRPTSILGRISEAITSSLVNKSYILQLL